MKRIQLTQGKVALVDDDVFEYLNQFKWFSHSCGYAVRNLQNGKQVYMHREIMKAPDDMEVDHVSGMKNDNRRSNLRICSRSQNEANKKKPPTNTSGYKGVRRHRGKWLAQIMVNKHNIYLGVFGDLEEAARTYDNAARNYFGEFAYTNFQSGISA